MHILYDHKQRESQSKEGEEDPATVFRESKMFLISECVRVIFNKFYDQTEQEQTHAGRAG